MDKKQAIYLKSIEGWHSDARLYKMVPPLVNEGFDDAITIHEYVVVSAVEVPYSGPETYIFGSDENGKVTNGIELDGSFQGELDHARALANIDYEIVHAHLLA